MGKTIEMINLNVYPIRLVGLVPLSNNTLSFYCVKKFRACWSCSVAELSIKPTSKTDGYLSIVLKNVIVSKLSVVLIL